MERKNYEPTASHIPMPAVLATVQDNIITLAWTGICNSEPPRAYVSIRKQRYSHGLIMETMDFVIHVVDESLLEALKFCGRESGRNFDKFKELGLNKITSKEVSSVTIAEARIAIECKVSQIINLGTHDMFIGDIVNISRNDSEEKPDNDLLISYIAGKYYKGKEI